MKLVGKLSQLSERKRKWISIIITVCIAGVLSLWGIYGIREYGIALFILTPFLIGFCSTVLYGYQNKISKSDAIYIGFSTLGICTCALILFAIEGLICIVMAAPIGIGLTFFGSLIGYSLLKRNNNSTPSVLLILVVLIPLTSFVENKIKPELTAVTTSIVINATPIEVWKNVIEFPPLDDPTEFIFKTGIAYPINAKIVGRGVGSIRYCNFTTGSFVEPITVWHEGKLLKFDVLEQPAPMKELSFWKIDAPHLHDYFVSRKGQFKLIELENGKTLLEGTTWYYHNIRPTFYWQKWSNLIIHKIHNRVLDHIKKNSEKGK
ncbi:SRPBCC family protein [Flavobacterium agrisoli]|uniref:Polyketide cyclase/dehydrase/lipid transport protein n=1 Tax=Flavobacterium agrisoli TaxID=2793066 RepID=A0A934UIR3_9FLAO|nr:hypothetical protein [Flavobacterium agrisoli]MBK0369107.1 hypothetical protein [Flavobacterium agrisoli]